MPFMIDDSVATYTVVSLKVYDQSCLRNILIMTNNEKEHRLHLGNTELLLYGNGAAGVSLKLITVPVLHYVCTVVCTGTIVE